MTDPRPLPPDVRDFLDAPRFAVVATVGADGTPHQAVAWYRLVADGLVLNSREGRRWPTDLRRDRRVSIAVEDGYDNVVLEGEVDIDDDQERAQADIAEMACRYHADDPARARRLIEEEFRRQRRVSFVLRPQRVHAELGEG
ncbi:MAG TPA: pyridoxamine 5'-phosphate oxidase family protein [Candidatus Limnocylindrales bacterium]